MLVLAVAIFVCVFFGPFDTNTDLVFWDRVVFWTIGITSVAVVIEVSMITMIESAWTARWYLPFRMLLGAMIGAIPGTSFMVGINALFRPDHLNDLFFPDLWWKVTVMSLLIAGLDRLIWSRLHPNSNKDERPSEDVVSGGAPLVPISMPRLFSRLPDKLREGQIVSMSMQDHYVEITTTNGSEMLLMRLSDAIDLLDGMAGAQTHRSHWAARAHSVSLAKEARRYELTLSDGRTIPVSNSYKNNVEQMLNEKGQA